MSHHVIVWAGHERTGMEIAHVRFEDGRLSAHGTQIGVAPDLYQLDYRLETDEQLRTKRLQAEVTGNGWTRRIDLRRDELSRWDCTAAAVGHPDLPPPGGDMPALDGAEDCDLGFSPLTNLMPVRRAGLLDGPGRQDFLMAWVAVPALQVIPARQTYEHIRRDEDGVNVRYVGRHRGYTGELRFDHLGFIELYPGLGQRLRTEETS